MDSKSDKIDIINWNVCGFKARLEEIKLLIKKHDPIILCIQEIMTDKAPKIRGYHTVLSQTGNNAILIKEGYVYEVIDFDSDLDIVGVKLKLIKFITVASIYISPHQNFCQNDLENILSKLDGNFILSGDVNAQSTLWGSSTTNTRGRKIEKFCLDNNIYVANDGNITHIPNIAHHRFSAIDITFTNPLLAPIISWKTNDEPLGSDHLPIFISCNLRSPHHYFSPKYIFSAANWSSYSLDADLTNVNFNQPIDQVLEEIVNIIKTAADNNIPKTLPKTFKKYTPWFTKDIKTIVNRRKHLYTRFKNNVSVENMIAYKQARAKATLEIKKAKRESWENCLEDLNHTTNSREIWQKIRLIEGRCTSKSPKYIVTDDDKGTDDPKEMAEHLATFFDSVSSDEEYNLFFRKKKSHFEKKSIHSNNMKFESEINREFTLDELEFALQGAKSLAAGSDGIPYILLKKLSTHNKSQLLKFYNLIFTSKSIPKALNDALIIPFIKDSSKSPNTNNFRPISLLNTISKILEKMINHRLIYELEKRNLIDDFQFGFRKSRSTVNNLTILESEVAKALQNKMVTTAVFFDIQKAYDKIWRYGVLNKLKQWGFGAEIFYYIQGFLMNRTFSVSINNVRSSTHTLENGIPQGSSLSVTLFLIGMEQLLKPLKREKSVKYLVYADDLVIFNSSKNPKVSAKRIQKTINKLKRTADEIGFTISEEKTKSIVFTRKLKPIELKLRLGNYRIKNERTIKFLGLIWDKKLNWNAHIRDLKVRVNKRLNILNILSKVSWGASRSCLEKIVTSVIISTLQYGSTVYGSGSPSVLKILEPCLNNALRKMTGAFRTSPVQSILVESGIPSLTDQRKLQDLKLWSKFKSLADQPTSKYVFPENEVKDKFLVNSFMDRIEKNYLNTKYDKFILPSPKIDIAPWEYRMLKKELYMKIHVKDDTTNEEIRARFNVVKNHYNNHNHFFTDGSKTCSGVGFAVFSENVDIKTKIMDCETVFTAEGKAILQAIGLINIKKTESKNIIFSDSLSVIEAITNRKNQTSLIKTIRTETVRSNHEIVFCWIPSHRGILQNDKVDRMAKLATESTGLFESVITFEDMSSYVKKELQKELNLRWQVNTNKLRLIKSHHIRWLSSYKSSRREEVVLCRLRIGHSRLTHEHYITKDPHPICECGELTTIHHILTECHFYTTMRHQSGLKENLEEDLEDDITQNDKVLKFTKAAGIFEKF